MGGTSVCGSGFCLPESPGPCFDIWSQIYWPKHMTQWWVLCHQQVRMAGTIGNIPKSLWGKSICPSLSYLLLGQHSWQANNWSKKEHYEISIFTHLFQKHFSDIKCWCFDSNSLKILFFYWFDLTRNLLWFGQWSFAYRATTHHLRQGRPSLYQPQSFLLLASQFADTDFYVQVVVVELTWVIVAVYFLSDPLVILQGESTPASLHCFLMASYACM